MRFCGFCGKGEFPTVAALNKHIKHTVNCNKSARQQFGNYANNMWDNAQTTGPTAETSRQEPDFQTEEETVFAQMPDIMLEDDLLGAEQLPPVEVAEPTPTPSSTIPSSSHHQRATVEDVEDEGETKESARYIEEFPDSFGAGSVWGEDVPFFEKIRLCQEEDGSSQWGPFKDKEEWELAEWLIRNVGQKQTDAFLNLNIVSYYLIVHLNG